MTGIDVSSGGGRSGSTVRGRSVGRCVGGASTALVLRAAPRAARVPPARKVVHLLSHYAGWLCIHSREGAWGSQTGNGYYGGLQMSYGWAGRVTQRGVAVAPAAQIAAADAEAREHGYCYSWMRGQWPNTFPPCAGLFR